MSRTFTVEHRGRVIVASFKCDTCKLTNQASAPAKASYGGLDVEHVAHVVARLSDRPCGCTDA